MTPGVIEGNSCQITVDTGSDISLVRPDVLKAELEVPMTPVNDSRLRTVTGTTTPLQSRVDLKLQPCNLKTRHTFYLPDIADECILGMEYVKPAGAVLDLRESLMTIGSKKISLTGAKKAVEPVCHRVVAAVTTTLPPNSETVIPVKLVEQEKVWRPEWGLLHSSDAYPKSDLLVGCTLLDLNHEILPVHVMNMTTATWKIKKGSDLARCELVDHVKQPHANTVTTWRRKKHPCKSSQRIQQLSQCNCAHPAKRVYQRSLFHGVMMSLNKHREKIQASDQS